MPDFGQGGYGGRYAAVSYELSVTRVTLSRCRFMGQCKSCPTMFDL